MGSGDREGVGKRVEKCRHIQDDCAGFASLQQETLEKSFTNLS